jgi:hypothetical protein
MPELLRGPRTIKGMRRTNLALLFHDGQPLDERCLAQPDSRQGQNAITRPFGKACANCAEQLLEKLQKKAHNYLKFRIIF